MGQNPIFVYLQKILFSHEPYNFFQKISFSYKVQSRDFVFHPIFYYETKYLR